MPRTRITTTPPAGVRLRLLAAIALLTVAVAAGLGASDAVAASSASWRLQQLDADRCWDAATRDADANGRAEDQWYDLDDDCRWDTRLWNAAGDDGFLEAVTFDLDEDSHWEFWLSDTDGREGFDVAHFDADGDGRFDARWAMPRAAPTVGTIGGRPELSAVGTVGGTPDRGSGLLGIVHWLAERTGRAVWSTDADGDGSPDAVDRSPRDPRSR